MISKLILQNIVQGQGIFKLVAKYEGSQIDANLGCEDKVEVSIN